MPLKLHRTETSYNLNKTVANVIKKSHLNIYNKPIMFLIFSNSIVLQDGLI